MKFTANLYYWGQNQNRIQKLLEIHLHNEKIHNSIVGFSVGLKRKIPGSIASSYVVVKGWGRELRDKQVV